MSASVRVFVNATPVEVAAGTDVRGAIRAHDPALEASAAAMVSPPRVLSFGQ